MSIVGNEQPKGKGRRRLLGARKASLAVIGAHGVLSNAAARIKAAFYAKPGAANENGPPLGIEADARRASLAPLVDADWYRANHGDAGGDPYAHYMTLGVRLGARPNPYFDTNWYLTTYLDVAAGGIHPLEHYSLFGWREGRSPSAEFDGERYLDDNPDLRSAGVSPLQHYLSHGRFEKRPIFGVADRASRPTAPPPAKNPRRIPITVTRNSEADALDRAILALLRRLAPSCAEQGPIGVVFAVEGSGENVAVSFAKTFLDRNSGKSALLLVTDDSASNAATGLPPKIHRISVADFTENWPRNARVEFLSRILQALRPEVFHIVDSDLAWALLAQKGQRVRALGRVFGSFPPGRPGDRENAGSAGTLAIANYYCEGVLLDFAAIPGYLGSAGSS